MGRFLGHFSDQNNHFFTHFTKQMVKFNVKNVQKWATFPNKGHYGTFLRDIFDHFWSINGPTPQHTPL